MENQLKINKFKGWGELFGALFKKYTYIISNLTHYNYIRTKIKVNIESENKGGLLYFLFGTFKTN